MTKETFDIQSFIPQRPPLLLVDELIEASHTTGSVRSLVRDSWPLCEDGRVCSMILIEVFAQSAAVLTGHRKRHEKEQGGRGWLVGIRKTHIHAPHVQVGDTLLTEVAVDVEVDNYAVFKGRVKRGDEVLAEVEIQTYSPDEEFWATGGTCDE